MTRADYSRDFRSSGRGEQLARELAPALKRTAPASRRTVYTGPVKDRGEDARGNANVSREELESFRAQYGADKTLRDLLNADRTGKTPSPAAPAGRKAEGRKAEDRDVYRATPKMERELAEMKRPGRDAIEPVLGPEAGMAVLGRTALAGLGRGLAGMLGRRAAREVAKDRQEPPMYDAPKTGGVFRSARPRKEDIPTLTDEITPGLKKGGKVKSYAKGGSVRGAGCETRGKKTRYI